MSSTPITALLIGDTSTRLATLRKWLPHQDCQWQFAASFRDACRMMSQTEFDLVLCQYGLPDRTAFPLLDWLGGSRSTLLFSARVGRVSRWLPVIDHGERCLDRPLLRTADLPNALEELLDGHACGDATAIPVSAEDFEQVGTR